MVIALAPLVMAAAMQNAATDAATDKWTDCLVAQVERTYRSSDTTDAVVNAAMRKCAAQELRVRRAVERELGEYSVKEVSTELNKLHRYTRNEMRDAVVRLRDQNAAPSSRRSRPAASSHIQRPIEFFNRCRYPVRYFVYHIEPDGQWRTHGWYTAAGNQPARAINDERHRPLQHLEGERLYYYAETTGPTYVSWYGTQPVSFGGATYKAAQASLSVVGGKYQFGLNCNGR